MQAMLRAHCASCIAIACSNKKKQALKDNFTSLYSSMCRQWRMYLGSSFFPLTQVFFSDWLVFTFCNSMLNETQNNTSFTSAQNIFSWTETHRNFGEEIKKSALYLGNHFLNLLLKFISDTWNMSISKKLLLFYIFDVNKSCEKTKNNNKQHISTLTCDPTPFYWRHKQIQFY